MAPKKPNAPTTKKPAAKKTSGKKTAPKKGVAKKASAKTAPKAAPKTVANVKKSTAFKSSLKKAKATRKVALKKKKAVTKPTPAAKLSTGKASTTKVVPLKKTTAAKTPVAALPSDPALAAILKLLDENKAEGVVHVPLLGKSLIADHMVIASGRSSRHVTALSEMLDQKLAQHKYNARLEGRENGDWVLVDGGDIIIHLFRPEVRDFYNLEKLWGISVHADNNSGSGTDEGQEP